MAITTVFDTNDYANTASWINGEFITTYIPDVDVIYYEPTIDENNPLQLTRPLIWLQYYGDDFSDVGMGSTISQDKNGQLGTISLWAWYFVPIELGESGCLSLGSKLKNIYLQHKADLSVAGIRKPRVGSLRVFNDNNTFLGARQLISFDVILQWERG